MKRRTRRGVSLGTIIMLTLCCLVLAGFFSLLPRLTGTRDLRINAAEIAVAFDESITHIANVTQQKHHDDNLPTTAPFTSQNNPIIEANAAPMATEIPAPKYIMSLCAAGSIKVNSAVQKALTDDQGYRFNMLLEQLAPDLASDLTIATLENGVVPSAKLSDFNSPVELVTALQQSGIDALSLGHYDVLDGGMDGLIQTRQSIEAAGMLPYGAYTSAEQRSAPVISSFNGLSVALLSYQNDLGATGKKRTSSAEQEYAVAKLQLPVIAADIDKARSMGAQVVVVSLCWGKSTSTEPTKTQQELAQGIADAGADVILGTHAEAVQSVKILTANRGDDQYHPVLCAYNLGNLFTHNREKRASLAGVLLRVNIIYDSGTGSIAFDDLSYIPTYCWRGKENDVQRYRVLSSSVSPQPDFVDDDQLAVMERCLSIINDIMKDSGFSLKQ